MKSFSVALVFFPVVYGCNNTGSFTVNSEKFLHANGCYEFVEEGFYRDGNKTIMSDGFSNSERYVITFYNPEEEEYVWACQSIYFTDIYDSLVAVNNFYWYNCEFLDSSGYETVSRDIDLDGNEFTITCGCEDEGLSLSCLDDNSDASNRIGNACSQEYIPGETVDVEDYNCRDGGYVTCVKYTPDSLDAFQFSCSNGYESEIFGNEDYFDDLGEYQCAEGGIQSIVGEQLEEQPFSDCIFTNNCGFVGFDSDGDRQVVGGWGDYLSFQEQYRSTCQYDTYASGFRVHMYEDGEIGSLAIVCTPMDKCPQVGVTLPYSIEEYEEGLENDESIGLERSDDFVGEIGNSSSSESSGSSGSSGSKVIGNFARYFVVSIVVIIRFCQY